MPGELVLPGPLPGLREHGCRRACALLSLRQAQLHSCTPCCCLLLNKQCAGGPGACVSQCICVKRTSPCLTPPPSGRYLGNVTITFDAQGNLQSAAGVPLLLGPTGSSSAMTKDPAMVALVAEYAVPVVAAWTGKVGSGHWLPCLLACLLAGADGVGWLLAAGNSRMVMHVWWSGGVVVVLRAC